MGATAPSEHDLVQCRHQALPVEAADLSADTRLCQWKQTSIVANVDGRLRSQGAGEGAAIGSSCSWQQRQPQALAGQKVRKENPEAPCQAKRQRRVRLNSGAVLLFAFAPASGSASFGSAITSFAGVRWRLAERQDTPPARGTLRASSRKKSFHLVISGPDRHSAPVSGSATDRETKIWWFYVLINAHVSFLP